MHEAWQRSKGMDAKQIVKFANDLGNVAAQLGSKSLMSALTDLTDIYAATNEICATLEQLVVGMALGPRDAAALLTKLHGLLYEELADHMNHLAPLLNAAADELYER